MQKPGLGQTQLWPPRGRWGYLHRYTALSHGICISTSRTDFVETINSCGNKSGCATNNLAIKIIVVEMINLITCKEEVQLLMLKYNYDPLK